MHEKQRGFREYAAPAARKKKRLQPKKKKRGEFGTSLPPNTHAGHKAIFYRLASSIRSEAERCGVTNEVASKRTLPAWESIQKYALANGEWYDSYSGLRRGETSASKDPFQPNVDGVFPYAINDGEIHYHAPSNLVVTSLYLNYLKHAYIPAMLAHIVTYLKSNRGDMALITFMREMEDVYLMGLKTPFFMKKRLRSVPSNEAYAARRREWISGLPDGKGHGSISYTRKHYVGNCSAEPFQGWVPEGFDRIAALISQIELKFHTQTLLRGSDGCPFPIP